VKKGYAQIFLPTEPGMQIKEAAVYQIVRNVKWYHKWFPFLEPTYITYDDKEFERIIEKG
jgi:ribosome-associated toxin RatA of RatAB toxin-antitoxin module